MTTLQDGCQLDLIERKAEICYSLPNGKLVTFAGWLMLSPDRRMVIARKHRGRNRWQLTLADSVYWTQHNH